MGPHLGLHSILRIDHGLAIMAYIWTRSVRKACNGHTFLHSFMLYACTILSLNKNYAVLRLIDAILNLAS